MEYGTCPMGLSPVPTYDPTQLNWQLSWVVSAFPLRRAVGTLSQLNSTGHAAKMFRTPVTVELSREVGTDL